MYIKENQIHNNKPAAIIENLDEDLSGQAWDLLDMTKYRAHNWHTFNNLILEISMLHCRLV